MRALLFFCFFCFLSLLICLILSFVSLPLAKHSVGYYYLIKDHINAKTQKNKKRILLMSASDGMYGINGELIEQSMPYSFINYSMFYGLGVPFEYRIDKLISSAKKGDIILLPLNFGFYSEKEGKNYVFLQNMLFWGQKEDKIKIIKQPILFLETLMKSPIRDIPIGIIYRIQSLIFQKDSFLQKINQLWLNNHQGTGVNIYSLNRYGELQFHTGNIPSKIPDQYDYLQQIEISEYFLKHYRKLQKFAKSNHITLCLTFPPTIKNPLFNLDNPIHFQKISQFIQNLSRQGISIYGNPKNFQYSAKFFYDSPDHLNTEGAKHHTKQVLQSLKECINH